MAQASAAPEMAQASAAPEHCFFGFVAVSVGALLVQLHQPHPAAAPSSSPAAPFDQVTSRHVTSPFVSLVSKCK
jgi:hypothetical protein